VIQLPSQPQRDILIQGCKIDSKSKRERSSEFLLRFELRAGHGLTPRQRCQDLKLAATRKRKLKLTEDRRYGKLIIKLCFLPAQITDQFVCGHDIVFALVAARLN
jgi:hypothetical protein